MKDVSSRILRYGDVVWREAIWLQGNLKTITSSALNRLKRSILEQKIIRPFYAWENKKKIYILDGHHLKLALEQLAEEGTKIPDSLPAIYLDCGSLDIAKELVLLYSSQYAKVTEEGVVDFLKGVKIDPCQLKMQISIPQISLFSKKEQKELKANLDFAQRKYVMTFELEKDKFDFIVGVLNEIGKDSQEKNLYLLCKRTAK